MICRIIWMQALVLFAAARVRKVSNEEKKIGSRGGNLPSLLKSHMHFINMETIGNEKIMVAEWMVTQVYPLQNALV